MSILEKLAAGHTFGGGPEDVASFQADQDESGDPRLQMQYTPGMNDEMTQALMRIIQERATQPPPEEKPKGMNPILKGALGGGGVGALGGAGVGALLGGASKGWLDTPAMILGGAGAGALAGGAGGALGAHLSRPKEASTGEEVDHETSSPAKQRLINTLKGMVIGGVAGAAPAAGIAGAMGSNIGLPMAALGIPGALIGGTIGALRSPDRTAFDQGYSDALAKLGYDSKKLQMIGGPAAVNPKATAGGTKSQVVLPKGRKSKGGTAKSDAGF